jgi:hypothetical protein
MEHTLHLASHHFIKSLKKASNDSISEEMPLSITEEELREVESGDGEYTPGDVLGKALSLITIVSSSK